MQAQPRSCRQYNAPVLSVAILGAGPIGAAIAQRLADEDRVREIVLVDENQNLAAGKALDIRQSGPVSGSGVALRATADPLAAAGAGVTVLADDSAGGTWDGERGLALVERLIRAGAEGPLVFAAPEQLALMETAARELGIDARRLVATAPAAMASTNSRRCFGKLGSSTQSAG